MREVVFPYPPRHTLRAVWGVDPMPDAFIAWQRDNLRRATSTHEAGHAFMMLALGLTRIRAVVSDDGLTGHARHFEPPSDQDPAMELARRRTGAIWAASCFHAGREAELLLGGFHAPGRTEWRSSGSSDFRGADGVLGGLFWRGCPHGYAKAVARAILSRNWSSVERIAQVLLERGEWEPADTADLVACFGEGAESIYEACLAYGESEPFVVQPAGNRVLSDPGETRPHSPGQVGGTPGHIHVGARPERCEPNPGGASGVVIPPFAHPTISRRQFTQFAHAATGETAGAFEES